MNPTAHAHNRVLLHSALVLSLLVLLAWALQYNFAQRRLQQSREFDRQLSEYALILQGRLEAVLSGARFAATRLDRDGVLHESRCQSFLLDLIESQSAIIGGAVYDGLAQPVCASGVAPQRLADSIPPDSWRLRERSDGSLQLDYHRSSGEFRDVLVLLALDAQVLTASIEPTAALEWAPFTDLPSDAQPGQAVRMGEQVVARVRPRMASEVAPAGLNLPAVAAVLVSCVVFTAMVLLWMNRRRQRGDSQRLMYIARHPQEELLRPRMRDDDLAAAAQVVVEEQRQLLTLSEQLGHANRRLEEVQRAASMGSWRLDLTTGRIDWSEQAYEIFGVPKGEDFRLERLFSLVHAEDRALVIEKQRAFAAGHADLDVVYRIERAGGEERVVHARGTVAARDAGGQPQALVGTVQDVTEAWEASGMSDALARALALSADPVLMTREHAGIWLWAWSNRAWERLCEQLQIDGREAHHQLFNPAVGLLRAHAERVREARAQSKVLRLDLELTTVRGLQWFEAELIPQVGAPGRAGHGLLLLRERTAERQGAQALRDANAQLERVVGERTAALSRSEQQYRVLADLSPQILWQADGEGRVSYFNRAWYELVGPRVGGWLGLGWMDALHPDDLAGARSALAEGQLKGQPWQARRRVKSRSGAYRSFLGVAAPVLGADGAVEGWVGVEADITELEQHAARLQQLNDELETFSYTVSHDLRAPVHVVKGFVEALLSGQVGQIDDQARGYLERVLRSALRMDELIADLLALSRLSRETLQLSRFDAGEMARGLVETIQERYPGRDIELHTQAGAVEVVADRRLFRVLLENLLDNAAKFTAGREASRIDLRWQVQHEELVLDVSDNGVGFPAEFAHRLFRPYQRLHAQSQFPGHGIGLATVARIVQLHGGSISAHNAPQGGAVFRIRLPWRVHATPADSSKVPLMET